MRRLLVTCTLALVALGCSEDPSPAEQRAALVRELTDDLVAETDGALDADRARCVAEELVDSVGVAAFDELVAAAVDEPDDERDELRRTVIDAFAGCDALQPLLDQPPG